MYWRWWFWARCIVLTVLAAEAARHVVSDQVQRSKETKVGAAEQVVSGQRSGVSGQRSMQRSKESKVSAAEPVVGDQSSAAEQVASAVESVGRDQYSGVRNQRLVRQSQWSGIGRGIGVWGTIRTVQKEYRKM